MNKFVITLSIAASAIFFTYGTAQAATYRDYTIEARVPSGLCHGIRFYGTKDAISYDDYFQARWLDNHNNSESMQRQVRLQKKYITNIQNVFCN